MVFCMLCNAWHVSHIENIKFITMKLLWLSLIVILARTELGTGHANNVHSFAIAGLVRKRHIYSYALFLVYGDSLLRESAVNLALAQQITEPIDFLFSPKNSFLLCRFDDCDAIGNTRPGKMSRISSTKTRMLTRTIHAIFISSN